jgi:hypothetical protein
LSMLYYMYMYTCTDNHLAAVDETLQHAHLSNHNRHQ